MYSSIISYFFRHIHRIRCSQPAKWVGEETYSKSYQLFAIDCRKIEMQENANNRKPIIIVMMENDLALLEETRSFSNFNRLLTPQDERQQVDQAEYKNPDTINEVPVELRRLDGKVLLCREMSVERADQADQQEDEADCHV